MSVPPACLHDSSDSHVRRCVQSAQTCLPSTSFFKFTFASGALLVVAGVLDAAYVATAMYSRCGKCRMIAPFVDELAEKYPNMVRLSAELH